MPIKLFGFQFGRPKELEEVDKVVQSPVPPTNQDGALTLQHGFAAGGAYTYNLNVEDILSTTSVVDMINRYRDMALHPEADDAINDIVNEAVIRDEDTEPVTLRLDDLPQGYDTEKFKSAVLREFNYILDLLNWTHECHDLFRQWYVDGRLFFDVVVAKEKQEDGILELRMIDPRCIIPMRELVSVPDPDTGTPVIKVQSEYYQYNASGFRQILYPNVQQGAMGAKLTKDRVVYVHSGVMNSGKTMVLSHLHKAIKPLNQLRMIEDASVIYRLARAPERRIFYVDVGSLPKNKAEQYINDIMQKYKNKLVYDASTGEMRDDRKFMSMLEDFWLPRREGSKGTEITNLEGGQHLGEMTDVEYFKRKLYKALNVPYSRTEQTTGYSLGRATEITRDEIKFARFLSNLRARFTVLFDELMARHLVLKNIIKNKEEWDYLRKTVSYDWAKDNYFSELKQLELMRERLNIVSQAEPYMGKYFSNRYVRTHLLQQTEADITQIDQEIEEEGVEPPQMDAFGNPMDPAAGLDGMSPMDPLAGTQQGAGNPFGTPKKNPAEGPDENPRKPGAKGKPEDFEKKTLPKAKPSITNDKSGKKAVGTSTKP
jgi:hypothetical protein